MILHPKSILSIDPNIELKHKIEIGNYNKINVFVDFKNACISLFLDNVVQEIVHNNNSDTQIDSSIFQSIVFFIIRWKEFCKNIGVDVNFYFCNDHGDSCYHRTIDKKYKENRKISSVNNHYYFEDLAGIRLVNCDMAEKIINRLNNVYFFNLKYLESDFLPYYLINRKINTENTLNVVCSNDKDHFQLLKNKDVIQIYKLKGVNFLYDDKSVYYKYFKIDKNVSGKNRTKRIHIINDLDVDYIVSIMAIIGDTSDNIVGVKGLGPNTVCDMFENKELVNYLIGTPDEIKERIINNNKFFKDDINKDKLTKPWLKAFENESIIVTAYKLISYELLCNWVDNKSESRRIEYFNYIENILSKKDFNIIDNGKVFYTGLKSINKLFIEEEHLDIIFNK